MYWKICIVGTLKKKFTGANFLFFFKRTYFGAFESTGIGLLNYIYSRPIPELLKALVIFIQDLYQCFQKHWYRAFKLYSFKTYTSAFESAGIGLEWI